MLKALFQKIFLRRKDRIFLYYQRRQFQRNIKLTFILMLAFLSLLYFSLHYGMFVVKMQETSMKPFASKASYLVFERFSLGLKRPFRYEAPDAFFYTHPLHRGEVVALVSPYKKKSSRFRKIFDFPVYLLSLGLLKLDKREHVVRRVLALPGERVSINNKTIYLNGDIFVPPWQMYFQDIRVLPRHVSTRDHFSEVVIPGGYVFVLNDNWDTASDSRSFGLVPIYRLEGNYFFHLFKASAAMTP